VSEKSTNQKQELSVATMFVNGRDDMSNLYRRPSIVASYQVSVFIVSSFSEIMCTDFVCLYTYEF
jgi:hypothetical protein